MAEGTLSDGRTDYATDIWVPPPPPGGGGSGGGGGAQNSVAC